MRQRSVAVLLAAIAILLFWTSQAAWGRVVADGMRFKFDLTGVARISNPDAPNETRDHCTWYERAGTSRHCSAAPTGGEEYRLLQIAPVAALLSALSFVGILLLTLRGNIGGRGSRLPVLGLVGALAMVAAIELLTRNVGRAVAVYVGRSLEVHGSGLTSAWLIVALFSTIAALTVRPRSLQPAANN